MRERGEPIAALWASEETIYGRYGYGLSSLGLILAAKRQTSGLRVDLPAREGTIRMIDHDEAVRLLPPLYNRIGKRTVGFLARPRDWWELRTLDDREEQRRGAGPLNRVLLELDGKPAGYAIYRIKVESSGEDWHKKVIVHDAFGIDPRATLPAGDRLDQRNREPVAAARSPALPADRADQRVAWAALGRSLASASRCRRGSRCTRLCERRARDARDHERRVPPGERRHVDGRWWRSSPLTTPARCPARRPGARGGVPRRLLVP